MESYELRPWNQGYGASEFLVRIRALLARDDVLLGSAVQRSVLMRSAAGEIQHVLTRIDILAKSEKEEPPDTVDYGSLLLVTEALDRKDLLNRLIRLSDKCFEVGDRTLVSSGMGFSDRYEPSHNSYSQWPTRIFEISFSSVQLNQEPMLHPRLKAFSNTFDAIGEFLGFDRFNGASDGRLGHVQVCVPNLNARIKRLDLNGNHLSVVIEGSAPAKSLKLSLSCKNGATSTTERSLDSYNCEFEMPFAPSELQLWLISLDGFLADFHDENYYRSAGANSVLPKQRESGYDLQLASPVDFVTGNDDGLAEVFVVHGHNAATKEAVARFIEKLGLRPVILHEQANRGNTIIEKFERHAGVAFAVVLVTGDDEAREAGSANELRKRPRQNVVFEFGFFVGKLGRAHVCALVEEGVEVPSDYQGVVYIPLDPTGNWKLLLVRELKSAGFDVDANRAV
jgi:CAP12/Pycsar effector protein, TIR domain